jgi:glyoxylase-like metal-dependent hydrolase (beta-lactamase superfamily II)
MRHTKQGLTHSLTLALLLGITLLIGQAPEPDGAGVRPGSLPADWVTGGPKCMEVPEFQVHEYNQDFYILRQSGCSHYEKPFLYLLFGDEKAILFDTGAGVAEVFRTVTETVDKWLKRKGRESIPLEVVHTHNHSDHTAGDAQFKNRPNVTFVSAELDDVKKFFGFTSWPEQVIQYDLGNRVLDIFGVPGHQLASIAVYDRQTGVLITGDIVYPGRLYIDQPDAFKASIQRMLDFTRNRVVTHVLGCHIEQSDTPYLEYPIGTIYQPNEHRLELSRGHLLELHDVVRDLQGELPRIALRDMTIYPVTPKIWEELRARRKEVEERQRTSMWNQTEAAKP